MTYLEFRYSLANNLLQNTPGTVVVNFNEVPGSSPATATIDDIAIVIEGNLSQLQEATSISLNIPQAGGIVTINVEASTAPLRDIDKGVVGVYYCYSIRTPEQRPTLLLPSAANYPTNVVIEPITATGAYNYNTYNPLIGNTIIDRKSNYIVYSDRGATTKETGTNPVNIVSILTGQAGPASVQDSLYSDTGWKNGRYEGTKTTADTYGGIDPTITGISFTGAYYPASLTDTSISTASTSTRVIEEFFVIPTKGVDTSVPIVTFPADPTKTAVYQASAQITATRVLFDFTVISGVTEVDPIEVGDYLYLYNVDEIVKVEQVSRSGGTTNVTVKRYMFGTNPTKTVNAFTVTARVLTDSNRIYQIENNRIEFIGESKVWIEASGEILRLDELGYSMTGSIAT
jgi:hypothetical protein